MYLYEQGEYEEALINLEALLKKYDIIMDPEDVKSLKKLEN